MVLSVMLTKTSYRVLAERERHILCCSNFKTAANIQSYFEVQFHSQGEKFRSLHFQRFAFLAAAPTRKQGASLACATSCSPEAQPQQTHPHKRGWPALLHQGFCRRTTAGTASPPAPTHVQCPSPFAPAHPANRSSSSEKSKQTKLTAGLNTRLSIKSVQDVSSPTENKSQRPLLF